MTSPNMAKEAVTPPVGVGEDNKEGDFSLFQLRAAEAVLAICMSEKIPSCILAPPLAVQIITGVL